jgi:hemin uptake protein HemP
MDIAQLGVLGVTSNGKLWHTTRTMERSVDTWVPWQDIEAGGAGDPGPFISVGSVRLLEAVRVCGITHDGKLWYSSSLPQQAWQPFDDVTVRIGGQWGTFRNVGIAETAEGLHVCVTASTASGRWRMLHTIRHEDGTWDAFQDVNALTHFAGSFISIDCEGIGDDLHVGGVTQDGKLWHTIRSSQNAWQPFKDVQETATNAPDHFSSVSIAAGDIDHNLHFCAQAEGNLWHTIRFSTNPPSWQHTFDNIKEHAGNPGSFGAVSCQCLQGDLHVCGITHDGKLWHTIRFSNPPDWPPGWLPFEDVATLVGSPTPGLFVFVSLAGIVIELFSAQPAGCKNAQNEIYTDCYRIRHSHNAAEKQALKQRVQFLENHPAGCNPDIPAGCLS